MNFLNQRFVNELVMLLKKWFLENYLEKLATYRDWPINSIKPSDMACANLRYQFDMVFPDIGHCTECNLFIHEWKEGESPIEEHKRYRPECIFVKSFADHIDSIKPTDEEIVNYWKIKPIMREFKSFGYYSDEEINLVLKDKLQRTYRFFTDMKDIFRYFKNFEEKNRIIIKKEDTEEKNETENLECKICFSEVPKFAFITCGHLICETCIQSMKGRCHLCRNHYIRAIRIFFG